MFLCKIINLTKDVIKINIYRQMFLVLEVYPIIINSIICYSVCEMVHIKEACCELERVAHVAVVVFL